jgi:hypothetical protein
MTRRLLLLLVTVTLAATGAAAFDWGGYLDNTTGIELPSAVGNELDLIQSTTVGLWATADLGSWRFGADGSYTYTPAIPVLFNVNEFYLANSVLAADAGLTTFGMTVGRTNFSSAYGQFMATTLDGLSLKLNWPKSNLRIDAATNALVYRPLNPLVISDLDANASGIFAPPRLIVGLDYRLIEVFAGQHLSVGVLVQEDLRPDDQVVEPFTDTQVPGGGGHLDTQYVTLGLSGGLAPGLFHRTYYTFNSGRTLTFVADSTSPTGSWYEYQLILAHLAGTELTYFLPEVLNSRVRVFGQFSTGDADATDYIEGNSAGISTAFVPLAAPTISETFSLQPGNSAHVGVSYSIRPLAAIGLDVLQTEVKAVGYLRTAGTGPVSEPGVDASSNGVFVGADFNLLLTYQPFSDVRLELDNGLFVPNTSVMNAAYQNVTYRGSLRGIIRF